MDVFTRVGKPDAFMWSSVISAFARHGKPSEAVQLYHEMRRSGVKGDAPVFVAALKACTLAADLESGRKVHSSGIPPDFVSWHLPGGHVCEMSLSNLGGDVYVQVSELALICALLFKYAGLAVNNLQNLECCLIVLFPYFSYMVAESIGLSGIVSILFCGITMKHYTLPNLSENAQVFTAGFFQLISSLAETFVFIYMGADIAIEKHSWSHVGFIFFAIVAILVARAANVFPSAYLVNLLRPASRRIPLKHQKALWFSGLRGAMAFALALQSKHDLDLGPGGTIFTTTTSVVILTVLAIGGLTSTMLEKLEVATGEGQNVGGGEGLHEESLPLSSYDIDSDGGIPPHALHKKFQELRRSTSFTAIDEYFLKPIFTSRPDDSMGSRKMYVSQQSVAPQTTSEGRGRPLSPKSDRKSRSNIGPPGKEERHRPSSSVAQQLTDTRQRENSLTRAASLPRR